MLVVSIALVVSRRDVLRSEHRLDSLLSREAAFLLNNIVLVGLAFVVFWGTFFPLISEAVTGTKASVGPPWFNRYIVPLALILVLLSGIGPVIAWRRATLANARRNFLIPIGAAAALLVVLLAATDTGRSPLSVALFCFAAFVVGSVGQEYWRGVRARRAMSHESPHRALLSLVRRNRRRYGGYLIHVGVAVLFVGVAASSTFQHNRDVQLVPGQSASMGGGYTVKYVAPTASVASDPKGTGSLLDLGAVLDVSRGGHHVTTLRPSAGYYPVMDPTQGPVGQLIGGEAVSHIGLHAGLRRDIWTAVQPNLSALRPMINRANQVVPSDRPDLALWALWAIAKNYRTHPPAAEFRLINSPLVTWIWLGGMIVLGGGLLTLWPTADPVRRRVRAGYFGRVARDVGRFGKELGRA
jgi:cytochrome c-type biogenesis protein CcmF